MNVRTIRRSAGCMLGSLAVIAWGFCCGRPAAAQAVSPVLIVSLLQQSTGIATSGSQTIVNAAIRVSGSLPAPMSTSAFGTLLSWNTSSLGVTGTNLYTVNASGFPSTANSSMIVDGAGFLYANFDPDPLMVTASATGRNISVTAAPADTPPVFPILPAGSFTDITIMQVRFGVSPNITRALFDFTFNGSAPTYGISEVIGPSYDNPIPVSFTNGGGSILITPEPDAMTTLFVGGFATGGWGLISRRRSRRQPLAAA